MKQTSFTFAITILLLMAVVLLCMYAYVFMQPQSDTVEVVTTDAKVLIEESETSDATPEEAAVVPVVEGETVISAPAADSVSLDAHPWTWVKTTKEDTTEVLPNTPDAFTITFTDDGSVSITTDCNTMGGTYTVDGYFITFGPLFATEMYCEGSQEQEFAAVLADTQSFFFTPYGEMYLVLESGDDLVLFR